ncbi:MAG TPA: MopE-related protein, partial [Bacteroidales bacterium]|nr:MopE-related protein [Bacteroidales bacterium]
MKKFISLTASILLLFAPVVFAQVDTDGDGLSDDLEAIYGTDVKDKDTDNDGLLDGVEDANHNGIKDPGETNALDADTDDDGISDGEEIILSLDNLNPDSDNDYLNDGLEIGRNKPVPGGISEGEGKVYYGTAAGWTPDSDPSTKTDSRNPDTDNDGLIDGKEDTNQNGLVDKTESDPNKSDTDDDGSPDGVDCNNIDPSIHPGAAEIPADGVDQDCDGKELCYVDSDGDGYRPDGVSTVLSADCDCDDPGEALATAPVGDCDDTKASVHPGAAEIPADGVDQDCDGKELCYVDSDGDGYRPDGVSTVLSADCDCDDPGEALATAPVGDCDDTKASVHPGAAEIPADGVDQDCDGKELCYVDSDGDGYRPDGVSTVLSADCDCDDPGEALATAPVGDCDDTKASVHPGAAEIPADGVDQDCDGKELCYVDSDGDGYRPDGVSTVLSADCDCDDPGEALATAPVGDCDDNKASVHPGAAEIPADGVDQDCDGK